MAKSFLNLRGVLVVLAVLALISGCKHGGGGSASSSSAVQGIATPGNISVVTANNAN